MSTSVRLNNAIAALGFQNHSVAKVDALAKDWATWFQSVRPWLPLKLEFPAAYYFWIRYRDAHDNHAKVTGGTIAAPATVEPQWSTMLAEDAAWREQAIKDTARATGQVAADVVAAAKLGVKEIASSVVPSLVPVGIAVGALGFLVLATRNRARRAMESV